MKYYGVVLLFLGSTSVASISSADESKFEESVGAVKNKVYNSINKTSKIKITSSDVFALIYIDGEKAGMIDSTNTSVINVSPGEHKVQLVKKNSEGGVLVNKKIDIFIQDGALQEYNFENIKHDTSKVIGNYLIKIDGTVTDRITGLMWKQCSEGLSGSECQQGEAKRYNWQQAMALNGSRFAGYSDWRVPTIDELSSLVFCSNGTPAKEAWDHFCGELRDFQRPTINQTVFPNTQDHALTWYWSSSPHADVSSEAWAVSFVGGNTRPSSNVPSGGWVRLVRSGR